MKKSSWILILCMALMLGSMWRFQRTQEETQQTENKDVTAIYLQNEENSTKEKDYIEWVEFKVTCDAMKKAYQYDLDTYEEEIHLNWVDLLAYLGARYGGDFTQYQEGDLEEIAEALMNGSKTVEELKKDMQYYSYYREAYGAVLDGMVGEYEVEEAVQSTGEIAAGETTGAVQSAEGVVAGETTESELSDEEDRDKEETKTETKWKKVYGLKAFHPIAKGFPYSDYDDFGVSRSYGYKRNHLGHDMMGQVGTPVIAVESGYVAELGWNQYGGWRVGINSFDGKRYYYYAHLRQNRPYAEGLEKGEVIQAGDVIGYIGRTGYSTEENVNNIDEYHLHFGLQLIFDESQRDGNGEIWVSGYELVKFLYQHQSEVQRNDETKEWTRTYRIKDPLASEYKKNQGKSD